MNPAITIERVSKRYRIGGLHPGYLTFREVMAGAVMGVIRKLRNESNGTQTLWALRDI